MYAARKQAVNNSHYYYIWFVYRVDQEGQQREQPTGFESPKSDKSWSKEFDEDRQATIRSRRNTADTIISQADVEINEQFQSMGRNNDRSKGNVVVVIIPTCVDNFVTGLA